MGLFFQSLTSSAGSEIVPEEETPQNRRRFDSFIKEVIRYLILLIFRWLQNFASL